MNPFRGECHCKNNRCLWCAENLDEKIKEIRHNLQINARWEKKQKELEKEGKKDE